MEQCTVLVTTRNVPEAGLKLLREKCVLSNSQNFKQILFFLNYSCKVIICDELPYPSKQDIIKKANGVNAIFWLSKHYLDAEILDGAGPNLKIVGAMSAGTDNIDKQELKKRGIKLSHTPRVLDDSVAEVALLLALAAGRRLQEGRRDIET